MLLSCQMVTGSHLSVLVVESYGSHCLLPLLCGNVTQYGSSAAARHVIFAVSKFPEVPLVLLGGSSCGCEGVSLDHLARYSVGGMQIGKLPHQRTLPSGCHSTAQPITLTPASTACCNAAVNSGTMWWAGPMLFRSPRWASSTTIACALEGSVPSHL